MSDLDDEELEATRIVNGVAKESDIEEDIKILEELLDNEIVPRLHRKYRNALIEIIKEVKRNTCTYEQTDTDYNSWQCSNCKCEWCFDEETPEDNNTYYCPECGARIEKWKELEIVDE